MGFMDRLNKKREASRKGEGVEESHLFTHDGEGKEPKPTPMPPPTAEIKPESESEQSSVESEGGEEIASTTEEQPPQNIPEQSQEAVSTVTVEVPVDEGQVGEEVTDEDKKVEEPTPSEEPLVSSGETAVIDQGIDIPDQGLGTSTEADTVNLETEPTLSDTAVFQRVSSQIENTSNVDSNSYAWLIESMVTQQCQMHGVKNLDLTTFGLRAQVLSFPNLSVLEYGVHKFLGAPFTQEEEDLIIHRLGLHVAQSKKDKIVVRAVQEVKDERGMSFYSLLFDDKIAQRFANIFNYKVYANINEADVSKLVLVIQK